MKRIIDIPDNEYRHIKEYYEKNDIVEATYSYIYHGTPLDDVFDKIRTEIYQLHCHPKLDFVKNDDVVEMALEVIDKYK